MTAMPPRYDFAPTDEQRAFVAAAIAAGLPREVICRMMPRGKSGTAPLDPASLDEHFVEELDAGPMLALRLIVARVLQRALGRKSRTAAAAQMAVFKSLADWPRLARSEPGQQELFLDRLAPEERDTLRELLDKATGPDLEE